MKILALGNEFIVEDSFAKKIGNSLRQDFDIIPINDSFQLMEILNNPNEDFVLIDVVNNLKQVCEIKLNDLQTNSILSAHDFDATYILKLLNKKVKIIGIPMTGNLKQIKQKVIELIKPINF